MDVPMKVYHGTNESSVVSIFSEGFIIKKNKKHWLGNGIYFFNEAELAEWWASNPSDKFGSPIEKPAIIVVELFCDLDRVFDMRQYKSYQNVGTAYTEYSGLLKGKVFTDPEKLRCAFFDWFYKKYDIYLLIESFPKKAPSYFGEETRSCMIKLQMPYPETQYCVYNKDIIISKKQYRGEEHA